jgi:hypothetical protein
MMGKEGKLELQRNNPSTTLYIEVEKSVFGKACPFKSALHN